MNTKQLAEDVRLITNYTNWELIEIEQLDKNFNKVKGAQVVTYTKIMDDSDPENPSVSEIKDKIDGGEIVFVDNPYPNRKPKGTGKVAYIVNDNKDFPIEDFPDGSLSGADKGWNLEWMASLYGEKLFLIIDPKWDAVVRERHKKIVEINKEYIEKHIFDKRYFVKGIGTDEERLKISVEPPTELMQVMKEMRKELNILKKENERLKKPKEKKKKNAFSLEEPIPEPKQVEKTGSTVSSFAGGD